MNYTTDNRLLRIFIGESDTHQGRPLYEAIVEVLRKRGLAGTTVVRGIEGFGKSSTLHTAHILRLSEDLPIIIECVDTAEAIEEVLPEIDQMIGDGLVTLERVEVRVHRGGTGPR
jgi:PII-like signaling protein